MAAGLGARDTLRLEAAMPLYGHELSEQINPIQAGLAFAVNLEGREFIGRAALAAAKQNKEQPVRVGLELAGRRAAREHYAVLRQTSEASRRSHQRHVLAHVPKADRHGLCSAPICANRALNWPSTSAAPLEPARVVPLPFYKRKQ